jgi:hypothetical protein
LKNLTIIAATDFSNHTGGFYISSNESWPWPHWQTYGKTLKLYIEDQASTTHEVYFTKVIFMDGVYNVSIRYLDALEECTITLKLNNSVVASWKYTGTLKPVEKTFAIPLKKGELTVSVAIQGVHRIYLNLDYIKFSFVNTMRP